MAKSLHEGRYSFQAHRSVWAAADESYARMRDQLENKDLMIGIAYSGEPEDLQTMAELNASVNRVRGGMRVLSLTHDVLRSAETSPVGTFGCSWARPRMWEQYAAVHRGVCLVFQRQDFEGFATASMNQLGLHYRGDVEDTREGVYGSDARHMVEEGLMDPGHGARFGAVLR